MVRRLILQVLQSHRYQVVAMDCAQEALESVIDGTVRPQLLLTDVIMPGMNGKQLHERLVESIGELKVIYISGHSEQVLAEHGIAWELGCLMQKPFEIGALLGLVRSTLDARPAIDPNEASAGG
jgi:DNA-binding NtrC family response regulator